MYNKITIIILLLSVTSLHVIGQSNIRLNNYLENLYIINPAAIDDEASKTFSLAARKQWIGFPGAPSTVFATGVTYIESIQTQFGIKIFDDRIGLANTFNVGLSYAYLVKLNRNWDLHLGVAASYQNLSYDLSVLTSDYLNDPAFYSKQLKENLFNSDIGANLTDKSLTVGLSSQNIFSLFYKENKSQTNNSFLYAKYHFKNRNPINVQGGITAIRINSAFQMELNLSAYVYSFKHKELFQVGMFYRTRSEMGTFLGMNLSESLQAWYSFDYNVGGISTHSLGTHELMLIYKIGNDFSRIYRARYH